MAGQQAMGARENGVRTGHHVEVDVVVERLGIDTVDDARMHAQRIQVRREREQTTAVAVDQVAHAGAIDCEQRTMRLEVDDRQREIAAGGAERVRAALPIRVGKSFTECRRGQCSVRAFPPVAMAVERDAKRSEREHTDGVGRSNSRKRKAGAKLAAPARRVVPGYPLAHVGENSARIALAGTEPAANAGHDLRRKLSNEMTSTHARTRARPQGARRHCDAKAAQISHARSRSARSPRGGAGRGS